MMEKIGVRAELPCERLPVTGTCNRPQVQLATLTMPAGSVHSPRRLRTQQGEGVIGVEQHLIDTGRQDGRLGASSRLDALFLHNNYGLHLTPRHF